MPPTLAELRARKTRSLPTRTRTITLDLGLLADVQRLEEEKRDLLVEVERKSDDGDKNPDGTPRRKMAEGIPARVGEIAAELGILYDRMRESEGELLLRGVTGGEWQAWKDEHPAREDNRSDSEVAYSLCNATDLLNDLGRYVVSWDGEDLADGDWDGWLRDQVASGDLRDLVQDVVSMHEISGVRAPKSSTGSSGTGTGETV